MSLVIPLPAIAICNAPKMIKGNSKVLWAFISADLNTETVARIVQGWSKETVGSIRWHYWPRNVISCLVKILTEVIVRAALSFAKSSHLDGMAHFLDTGG